MEVGDLADAYVSDRDWLEETSRNQEEEQKEENAEFLEKLAETAGKKDDDTKFYEQFGKYLKLDVHADSTNRTKASKLSRFHTSNSGDELIWLKEYADSVNDGWNDIYCITGENLAATSFLHFWRPGGKGASRCCT